MECHEFGVVNIEREFIETGDMSKYHNAGKWSMD